MLKNIRLYAEDPDLTSSSYQSEIQQDRGFQRDSKENILGSDIITKTSNKINFFNDGKV